jgi:hypothetical protein
MSTLDCSTTDKSRLYRRKERKEKEERRERSKGRVKESENKGRGI